MSVRCIGLVFTEDKRGDQGAPSGGLAWWGRGLKLEGEVKEGQDGKEGEGLCPSVHYI